MTIQIWNICNYTINNSNLTVTEAKAEMSDQGTTIGKCGPRFAMRGLGLIVFQITLFFDRIFVSWLWCASPTLVFLYAFMRNMWRQKI